MHNRTKTDTGRQGEYPKALERTVFKELGNLTPYVRKKGSLPRTILLSIVSQILVIMVREGRSEVALATVYQKHSSLLNPKDDV